MKIVARLDEATLRTMLDELLPVTVMLDPALADGRWIRLEPTHHVDFVAGQGLRLGTSGRIRWIVAGVPLEATLHSATVMLRPVIVEAATGGKLIFRPSLEAADLRNVPAWLDRSIVAVLNGQLTARADDIAWDFGKTLHAAVPIPPLLHEIESLKLDVHGATVGVLDDAIEVGFSITLDFVRAAATEAASPPVIA